MYSVIGERFTCETITTEHSDPVEAINTAIERSNEHDMDWVIVLQDGFPIAKYLDGNREK